jgi:CheY-like chemotaxis protein
MPAPLARGVVPDDREALDPDKHLLLVVEDDLPFARILLSLAHELGFQAVVATSAAEGLELAEALTPLAILLDVRLPDRSGLSLLDNLKRRTATRHIPVHVVSVDDYAQQAFSLGAVGYLTKPTTRDALVEAIRQLEVRASERVRRVLVVEDDATQREAIARLLGGQSVEVVAVSSAKDALAELREATFDCIVTDLGLPDQMGGEDLLATMAGDEGLSFPPVIVYTGRELGPDEEARLMRYSSSIIVKGARSPERLLDEVTLFLHQVESKLPPERQRMLRKARDREHAFEGRRVLVVEDDVRNVFALTSVLEPRGLRVSVARNGKEALQKLDSEPVDLVLMDIMMPEMDGDEATRQIRLQKRFEKLPIIALTAKAMTDDRQRCLDAGANDYIPKPLDVDRLMSLLRVWLPPRS